MNYNASIDKSPEKHAEFIAWLSQRTVAALKDASGNTSALQDVVRTYVATAGAAELSVDEIENVLGIKEPSIMDLAELSESDEDIVITMFENLTDL